MKKIAILAIALIMLVGCITPVYASVPGLPHAFYGSVTVNGVSSPDGTEVLAKVDQGSILATQNPVTTVGGSYGCDSPYLLVQGDISDGEIITFYVNGVSTGQTEEWHSGEVTQLDLTVTITEGDGETGGTDGGGDGATQDYIETDLFGIEEDYKIDSNGKIQETFTATSEDDSLTLTIPKGTFALDKDGEPLEDLEAAIDVNPPDPPANAQILLAYDFGPAGATFDPPITLTWTYDPDDLQGDEEDLVFVYYSVDGEWVELDFEIDTENNTITVSIEHFTTFAVISMPKAAFTVSSLDISPSEVFPGEEVKISVTVANIGAREGRYTVILKLNDVKEEEKRITITAGGNQKVIFSVSRKDAGSYTVGIDGLSGSFTVVEKPTTSVEEETVIPPATPSEPEKEEVTPPSTTEPEGEEPPTPAPWYQTYWYYVLAGVTIVVIILVVALRRHRD